MVKLVLTKLGLKRLEPYDGKLSRTVLRGRRRWQHLFCYPTLMMLVMDGNTAQANEQFTLNTKGFSLLLKIWTWAEFCLQSQSIEASYL